MLKLKLVWLLAGVCLALGAGPVAADVIQYDTGVLSTSYSDGWGYYFANRFTNDSSSTLEIEAVLIRRTPSGGAADVYFWADDNGSPGAKLGGPVFEWLDDTWQSVDVSCLALTLAPGTSIFAGFEARSTAEYPYDNASPGAGRTWWDQWGDGNWAQGGPVGENSNLMVRMEVVPEPGALAMLALGGIALIRGRCKRGARLALGSAK